MKAVLCAVAVLACLPVSLRAGVYVPGEPPLFEVGEDGVALPLDFEQFKFELDRARAAMITDPPNEVRPAALERIDELADDPERVGERTALMIRVGDMTAALEQLGPAARQRRVAFPIYSHLAWAHFLSGQLPEAYSAHSLARDNFPREIEGYSSEQVGWYRGLEGGPVKQLMRSRRSDDDGLDRIFEEDIPLFSEGAEYKVGPEDGLKTLGFRKDAIAVVQQLVLWAPTDTRLYWQLGELYNADGNPKAAHTILDECTNARGYQNADLRDHRRILSKHIADQSDAVAQSSGFWPEGPRLWIVLSVAGVIISALLIWQGRLIWKGVAGG